VGKEGRQEGRRTTLCRCSCRSTCTRHSACSYHVLAELLPDEGLLLTRTCARHICQHLLLHAPGLVLHLHAPQAGQAQCSVQVNAHTRMCTAAHTLGLTHVFLRARACPKNIFLKAQAARRLGHMLDSGKTPCQWRTLGTSVHST